MNLLPSFGRNPSGTRLTRVQASKNYRDGEFRNLSETTLMLGRPSMLKMTWRFLNKPRNTTPPAKLPSVKTDLKTLRSTQPVIVWFGHSTYLIQINGKNILVDPVLGGHASPFQFGAPAFRGSDIYKPGDLPFIDVLIITHDHYDHLDHGTVKKINKNTGTIYTSLGVGSHLEYWGIAPEKIIELDWWDQHRIDNDLELIATPARHFSGRTTKRNQTLWSSFVLRTGNTNIYIGSDSGFDTQFKIIGEKFGPFDIAILETGQYNEQWPLIHMMPEEAVQASVDLRAKLMLPVHWGKFAISFHPWDEPVKRVLKKAFELGVNVVTPMIGEPIVLNSNLPASKWWETVKP